MERSSRKWLRIRIALVAISALMWSVFGSETQGYFSGPPDWIVLAVLVGFPLLFVIAMFVLRSDKSWSAPSWRENPFDLSRPLEVMHLCGWCFVAGAAAMFATAVLRSPLEWDWLLPASMGAGVLAGVRVVSAPLMRSGT